MTPKIRADDPRRFTWSDGDPALAGSLICRAAFVEKAAADPDAPIEFVMSDATPDRIGDVIEPEGWKLGNFRKNPVGLAGHDSLFAIGRWQDVRVEGGRLVGKLKLAAAGTSARIDEIRALVAQGIIRAVSVGFRPSKSELLDKSPDAYPWGPMRYLEQELLECSLVAVPANQNALIAKSISQETRAALVKSDARPASIIVRTLGKSAASSPKPKGKPMKGLSERITQTRAELVGLRDTATPLAKKFANEEELTAEELAQFEELNADITKIEKTLGNLEAAERISLGRAANDEPPAPGAPAPIGRGALTVSKIQPRDRLVSLMAVTLESHLRRVSPDQILKARYDGRDDLEVMMKAVTNPATTTQAGWAAELVQTAIGDFIDNLQAVSIYPILSANGRRHTFDRNGTITMPRRNKVSNAPGDLRAAWVGEGDPIPVRRGSFGAITLRPHKLGVIATATREIIKRSTPAIEGIIRQGILEDTADAIDQTLLDALPATTVRPAGLLNGVAAIPGTAGGGIAAIEADFRALLSPFIAANATAGLRFLINPATTLKLYLASTAVGVYPFRDMLAQRLLFGFPFSESTKVPATQIILLREVDFTSAVGDTPEFDVSDTATIHEEDGTYAADQTVTQPAATVEQIATGAPGAAVVATPVRSLWQTASIGIRMILEMDWSMVRAGMVSTVTAITW